MQPVAQAAAEADAQADAQAAGEAAGEAAREAAASAPAWGEIYDAAPAPLDLHLTQVQPEVVLDEKFVCMVNYMHCLVEKWGAEHDFCRRVVALVEKHDCDCDDCGGGEPNTDTQYVAVKGVAYKDLRVTEEVFTEAAEATAEAAAEATAEATAEAAEAMEEDVYVAGGSFEVQEVALLTADELDEEDDAEVESVVTVEEIKPAENDIVLNARTLENLVRKRMRDDDDDDEEYFTTSRGRVVKRRTMSDSDSDWEDDDGSDAGTEDTVGTAGTYTDAEGSDADAVADADPLRCKAISKRSRKRCTYSVIGDGDYCGHHDTKRGRHSKDEMKAKKVRTQLHRRRSRRSSTDDGNSTRQSAPQQTSSPQQTPSAQQIPSAQQTLSAEPVPVQTPRILSAISDEAIKLMESARKMSNGAPLQCFTINKKVPYAVLANVTCFYRSLGMNLCDGDSASEPPCEPPCEPLSADTARAMVSMAKSLPGGDAAIPLKPVPWCVYPQALKLATTLGLDFF